MRKIILFLIRLYNNKRLCEAAAENRCLCDMCNNHECKKRLISEELLAPEDYAE